MPDQITTVSRGWSGKTYAVGVHYDVPRALPEHCVFIGDIHSHCDDRAYSSSVDQHDEEYRSGVHIVVGRIRDEPPEFHIEATVDGTRFDVKPELALGGYHRRRTGTPRRWMEKVEVEEWGKPRRRRRKKGAHRAAHDARDDGDGRTRAGSASGGQIIVRPKDRTPPRQEGDRR